VFAVCAVILAGAAGIGLDYTLWSSQRALLQEAADSAALAGVRALAGRRESSVERAEARARQLAAANAARLRTRLSTEVVVDSAVRTVSVRLETPAAKSRSRSRARSIFRAMFYPALANRSFWRCPAPRCG
jgi:Flp pilus assembly protein TadG